MSGVGSVSYGQPKAVGDTTGNYGTIAEESHSISYAQESQSQYATEMALQMAETKSFEWGFGRNLQGELSLGVTKNALIPACALGLTDVSTRAIASSSN